MLWAIGMLTCPAVHANQVIIIPLIFAIFLIFFFPMFRHAYHLLLNGIGTNFGSTTLASTVGAAQFLGFYPRVRVRCGAGEEAGHRVFPFCLSCQIRGSLVSRRFAFVG